MNRLAKFAPIVLGLSVVAVPALAATTTPDAKLLGGYVCEWVADPGAAANLLADLPKNVRTLTHLYPWSEDGQPVIIFNFPSYQDGPINGPECLEVGSPGNND